MFCNLTSRDGEKQKNGRQLSAQKKPTLFGVGLVPRTRFELAHPFRRYHLKVVRLPISPPGQKALNAEVLFFVNAKV